MNIPAPLNKNYAATVVSIKSLTPIKGRDFIVHTHVFGNAVIVSKDTAIGSLGLFFPVESQLSHDLIASVNGYRKPEFGNRDLEAKPGFFDETRRVKCLKLAGAKSEGLFLPISCLDYTGVDTHLLTEGTDLDTIEVAGKTFEVCRKYVPKVNPGKTSSGEPKTRKKRLDECIVDQQFRLHLDTDNLRRNIHRVFPGDDISISWKEHGTSAVFANLLIQNDLKWYEKLLVKLGVRIQTERYGFIWSSRKVIKGVDGIEKPGSVHYYGEDVWGHVASRVANRIPKGYTVYGEILGFTPSGGAIQSMGGKPYDYGCGPNECKLHVYRVTVTNVDGICVDMPFKQMVDWCHQNGFETVPVIYYGKASEFLPVLPGQSVEQWQEVLLRKLEAEYVDDRVCHLCKSGVVQEGIVLRTDFAGKCESKKLKSFRFLSGSSEEADKGVVDLETAESDLAEDQA